MPGDTVLADRGFNIKDEVGLYCATVTYTICAAQINNANYKYYL